MRTLRGWWSSGYTIRDKDHRIIAENLLPKNATLFLDAVVLVDEMAAFDCGCRSGSDGNGQGWATGSSPCFCCQARDILEKTK